MKAIYSPFAGFKSIIFIFACFCQIGFMEAQDQCAPVGWATQNGNTTGGGTATPVTVNTLSALQTQASSTGAKVIYVSGTMGAGVGTRVVVKSDKTIFGLPGATLNGGFDVKDAENVIIRNMIIKGPGAIDVDGVDCMTIQNSTNVWIDHCDISDGQDGNLDVVNGSSYVTITWTKFHYSSASVEHQFCNLIGNSDSKTSDRGLLKVTMMFNYWTAGCVERMPRVRFGQVHVVNNLFDSPDGKYSVRAGLEANILVERNAFIGVTKPIDLYDNDFTAVTAVGNLFSGTTGNTLGSGTAFTPPYTLNTIAAANVEAKVKACVGATMTAPTVCPCTVSLPVEFINFEVKPFKDTYQLEWTISENEKVKAVAVEYSLNGSDFTESDLMEANKNSYILPDDKKDVVSNGILYLRLRVTEWTGEVTYSIVKSLNKKNPCYIYPNPFTGQLYISGGKGKRLIVYSMQGDKVYETFVSEQEINDLGNLSQGVYILHLIDSSQNEEQRMVITKL